MKHTLLRAALAAALIGLAAGCGTPPPSPAGASATPASAASQAEASRQSYLRAMKRATELVDEVTRAATTAIDGDLLKGQDADNTIEAIRVAKAGLAVARGIADPLRAEGKVNVTLAALAATQAYLRIAGALK